MALIDNIAAYFKLDELSGTDTVDSVASVHGTLIGASSFNVAGKINGCIHGADTNSRVDLGSKFIPSVSDFSVSFWVLVSNLTDYWPYIFSQGSFEIQVVSTAGGLPSGLVSVYVNTTLHLVVVGVTFKDSLVHCVVTKTGNSYGVYVNGVWYAIANHPFNNPQTSNSYLGRFGSSESLNDVYVDEIGIWKRALSQGEVDELYNSGNGLSYPFSAPAGGPVNLKSYNTNLKANIKTINTNSLSNVKSIDTNI